MKKRLNILCVLVFVAIGIGFLPFIYAMGQGFLAGWEQADSPTDGRSAQSLATMLDAPEVHLMPVGGHNLESATVRNAVSGTDVSLWPERCSVDVAVEFPGWFSAAQTMTQLLAIVCMIAIVVLFLKLIIRVNRGQVFEWRNVRLLRWLGGLELGGSIVTTAIQIYGASIINSQFSISGFATDYFSYISVTELSIGLVALIAAEIFAIGLKMKEEQDLTV